MKPNNLSLFDETPNFGESMNSALFSPRAYKIPVVRRALFYIRTIDIAFMIFAFFVPQIS